MPETKPKCGSRLRKKPGLFCKHPAGFRTEHPGTGRCWMHGGATPVKHGRRSTIKRASLRELVEQHAANPDPLNLFPELAQLRALVADLFNRWDETCGPEGSLLVWHQAHLNGAKAKRPRSIPRFENFARTIEMVGAMVDRIYKHEAKGALTKATFNRVMEQMGVEVVLALQETGIDETVRARLLDDVERRWSAVEV